MPVWHLRLSLLLTCASLTSACVGDERIDLDDSDGARDCDDGGEDEGSPE